MKIDVEQVWEYEFKPTDTMRLLHAFKSHWELAGDEITLENRGGRLFAVRREKTYKCPEIEREHVDLTDEEYREVRARAADIIADNFADKEEEIIRGEMERYKEAYEDFLSYNNLTLPR